MSEFSIFAFMSEIMMDIAGGNREEWEKTKTLLDEIKNATGMSLKNELVNKIKYKLCKCGLCLSGSCAGTNPLQNLYEILTDYFKDYLKRKYFYTYKDYTYSRDGITRIAIGDVLFNTEEEINEIKLKLKKEIRQIKSKITQQEEELLRIILKEAGENPDEYFEQG